MVLCVWIVINSALLQRKNVHLVSWNQSHGWNPESRFSYIMSRVQVSPEVSGGGGICEHTWTVITFHPCSVTPVCPEMSPDHGASACETHPNSGVAVIVILCCKGILSVNPVLFIAFFGV